jgi:hypothetical protein
LSRGGVRPAKKESPRLKRRNRQGWHLPRRAAARCRATIILPGSMTSPVMDRRPVRARSLLQKNRSRGLLVVVIGYLSSNSWNSSDGYGVRGDMSQD